MRIDSETPEDWVVCWKHVAGIVLATMLRMIAAKDVPDFRRGISRAALQLAAAFAHDDNDPAAFVADAAVEISRAETFGATMQ